MTKLLLVVAGFLLIYWLLKAYRKGLQKPPQSNRTEPVKGEDMVRCTHCGVHLPTSESITTRGLFFCCEEHRRLHHG